MLEKLLIFSCLLYSGCLPLAAGAGTAQGANQALMAHYWGVVPPATPTPPEPSPPPSNQAIYDQMARDTTKYQSPPTYDVKLQPNFWGGGYTGTMRSR